MHQLQLVSLSPSFSIVFFSSLARSRNFSLFSISFFSFCGQSVWQSPQFGSFYFFFFTNTRCGRLAEIRWPVGVSKSQRSLYILFSRTDSGLCIYHLFVWANFKFLHNLQLTTFPTKSCLVLHSFCANLMNSLIIWQVVSTQSPHIIIIIFYTFPSFSHHCLPMVSHWILSDSKFP